MDAEDKTTDDDLFEDKTADDAGLKEPDKTTDAEPKDKPTGDGDKTGDDDTGTPPDTKGKSDGKMIPEHRFKAALKDVTDELNATRQELAKATARPAPDKSKDPDGYDLHIRMESSKSVMRDMANDYDEVIAHYIEMAKSNPLLNQAVASATSPAKFAYDLAKKDKELGELSKLKDSDEYKQFMEFKKQKDAANADDSKKSDDVSKVVTAGLSKVPNLNRATDVSKSKSKPQTEEDDELFAGAL